MIKIGATCTLGLLIAWTATAQAAYSTGMESARAVSADSVRLAAQPKNKKVKTKVKAKNPNVNTTPAPSGDRGPAPGQGY
jgi:hypothetical protein